MDDLLSEEALFERSISISPDAVCGVYFLFLDKDLVYVGMAKNFLSRIYTHMQCRDFNRVAFVNVPMCEMGALEERYIKHFQPSGNKAVTNHFRRKWDTDVEPVDHSPAPSHVIETEWVSRSEAAAYMSAAGCTMSKESLARLAGQRTGPSYRRFLNRPLYSRRELDRWMVDNLRLVPA